SPAVRASGPSGVILQPGAEIKPSAFYTYAAVELRDSTSLNMSGGNLLGNQFGVYSLGDSNVTISGGVIAAKTSTAMYVLENATAHIIDGDIGIHNSFDPYIGLGLNDQ